MIKVGGGAIAEASSILKHLGVKRPLIVTDPFLVRMGLAESLRGQIEKACNVCDVFSETVPDPTTDAVAAGLQAFIQGNHDGLVSLGGGSPIDSAKAIGILASNGGRLSDYKVPNEIPNRSPLHLAIPTTAGTGSEVTRFTVITDQRPMRRCSSQVAHSCRVPRSSTLN
jgi:alcohol dehydrogenase class IV